MLEKRIRLIVGLGNPGSTYEKTRHNTGFMIIENIATTFVIPFATQKFNTLYGRGRIKDIEVILAKPMAFMNNSGPPVQKLADYFRIKSEDLLAIHDDIDLEFGRLKIKDKGGHGGHKGVKSLIGAFGGGEFTRLRIGVGRPAEGCSVTDHVLANWRPEEVKILPQIIATARDAVVAILCEGPKEGMNRFNSTRILNA